MTVDAGAVRHHAADVTRERLLRTRGRLRGLGPMERRAVEETAEAVGQAVARCLLESAATDSSLEKVLAGLYPSASTEATPG
jgi:hypothetical protein